MSSNNIGSRIITRIQDQDDFTGGLGSGNLMFYNGSKFALTTGSGFLSFRNVNTLPPLQGGHSLSTDITLTIPKADNVINGYLSNSDWINFNSKVSYVGLVTPGIIFQTPVTAVASSGNLTLTFNNQGPNVVFAGPSGLPSGTPTFRSLIAADLPNIPESQVTNLVSDLAGKLSSARNVNTTLPLQGGGTLTGDLTLSLPQASASASGYLSLTDWTTFNNKGTVSYVSLTTPGILFQTPVTAVTTSGTLALTFNNQAPHSFFSGPSSSSSGTPTFRSLVQADFPPVGVIIAPVVLTDAATVATNAALSSYFTITLGGSRTLGNPTNPTDGQRVLWRIKQDATGGRTLALDTNFKLGTDISSTTSIHCP
jgi:hypothetical protein